MKTAKAEAKAKAKAEARGTSGFTTEARGSQSGTKNSRSKGGKHSLAIMAIMAIKCGRQRQRSRIPGRRRLSENEKSDYIFAI